MFFATSARARRAATAVKDGRLVLRRQRTRLYPDVFLLPRLSQFDAGSLFGPTACVYPQQSVSGAGVRVSARLVSAAACFDLSFSLCSFLSLFF